MRESRRCWKSWVSNARISRSLRSWRACGVLFLPSNLLFFLRIDAHILFHSGWSRLPELRCVILTGSASISENSRVFFEAHGSKIEKLIFSYDAFDSAVFDLCANVKVLMFVSDGRKVCVYVQT